MSTFKHISQLVDAPLAIVVGSVGAVLIAIQLGAVGLVAQDQVDKAYERDNRVQSQRLAVANCLGAQGVSSHAACVKEELERSSAMHSMRMDKIAMSSVGAPHPVSVGMVPVAYTYNR